MIIAVFCCFALYACNTTESSKGETSETDNATKEESMSVAEMDKTDKKADMKVDIEADIEQIRTWFKEITNKEDQLTYLVHPTDQIEHHQDGFTFYKDKSGKLVKITNEYGVDGRITVDYYLHNDELIFIFDRGAMQTGEGVESYENRMYFKTNKLIRYIEKKEKFSSVNSDKPEKSSNEIIEPGSKEFTDAEKSYSEKFESAMKLLPNAKAEFDELTN